MPVNLLGGVNNNFLDKVVHNRRGKLGDANVLSMSQAQKLCFLAATIFQGISSYHKIDLNDTNILTYNK